MCKTFAQIFQKPVQVRAKSSPTLPHFGVGEAAGHEAEMIFHRLYGSLIDLGAPVSVSGATAPAHHDSSEMFSGEPLHLHIRLQGGNLQGVPTLLPATTVDSGHGRSRGEGLILRVGAVLLVLRGGSSERGTS